MRATAQRHVLRFLTFTLVLGVCGCGGIHWHKPDADSIATANDLEACRKEAQAKYGGATGALAMQISNDPRFGPMGPTQADARMQEAQAAGACMRKKGYDLVPDAK